MSSRKSRIIIGAIAMLYFINVLVFARVFEVAGALGEYLRPTTVEGNYLPQGCAVANETPAPDLMRIVSNQQNLYGLALQKVVVCRTASSLPTFETRFAGLPFGEELRNRWRPLRQGCCSAQFGRHVIVMVANPTENGSVLVRANLVQSRWDYLQVKCGAVRWVWIRAGTVFFIFMSVLFFSGRWLVGAIRRGFRRSV
jgi:hypothetical protein